MIVDPARVTEIIRETAELDVLPRFRKLAESEIMEKAPGDIVTVADYEAEERLSRGLKAIMPNAHILAEEAASRDGLELDDHHTEDATWLIDPVDGTRNFSKGETAFAIVVAFVTGGQVEQSWIHLPVSDETLVAERGCGAYTQDGTRLTAAQSAELSNMRGLVNFRGLGDDVPWEQVKARADTFS